jgi:hypothetical protein
MSDLDKLKDKYDKKEDKASSNVKNAKALTKELESKKDSAPVRAAKQAVSGFRSQWSGMDDQGKVGIGKGVPGIYYDTVAIPALAGVVDDKYAPEFAVEADKKAGRIKEAIRKDMGIEAPKGALEHFANAGGTMLAQLPVPGAWLSRVLSPVKSAGIAGKVATSPIEYLSPIVDPKKINYGVGTGFGGTIGTVGEMLEEEPVKKELGGLIQKYEDGGRVGKVKSFFSAVDKAIDTLKQKKGTGEQILKEIEKAPGVKKEELELRKIGEKLKNKKSITQEEVRALAAESPAPSIKAIVKDKKPIPVAEDWTPDLSETNASYLEIMGISPVVNPEDRTALGFLIEGTGDIVDINTLKSMTPEDFGVQKTINDYNMVDDMKGVASMVNTQFNNATRAAMQNKEPKFEKYTTPGGENYREILLQVDRPSSSRKALGGDPVELTPAEAAERIGIMPDDFAEDSKVLYYPSGYYIEKLKSGRYITTVENRDKLSSNLNEVEDFLASAMSSEVGMSSPSFVSGHFDEPNVVVHARVTDRKGPNGEKVLYVEEIQSDWHQAARKKRDEIIDDKLSESREMVEKQSREIMESIGRSEPTRENAAIREGIVNKLAKQRRAEIAKEIPKDEGYSKPMSDLQGMSADDVLWQYGDKLNEGQKQWLRNFIEKWELEVDGSPAGQAAQDQLAREYDSWISTNSFKGVPDAPWKNTANELAVKQILDVAAKEGYDTVAFSPGSEHAKRYGMSQFFDTLTATKEPNGQIKLVGTKEGRSVVDRRVDADELADYIGKEKAENIMAQLKKPPPRNEAGDRLSSLIDEWSQKYDDDFPITLKEKLTPEEVNQWDTLLEESRVWDRENRVQEGNRMVMPKQQAVLFGEELELTTAEGAGKKKIYDEIIPNFVRKYAQKEFGAEPGEIDISIGGSTKPYEQYLEEINIDPYRYFDEDQVFDELHERVLDKANVRGYDFKGEDADDLWDQMMTREGPFEEIWQQAEQEMYQAKAKELAEKDPGQKLKAFAVPVTPQMREKITGEGQKLFAAAPIVGVQGIPGMEEAPQAFDSEGSDYDYETARSSGMAPEESGENKGHWGSVTQASEEARRQYGLPEDSYMLLKGRKHETWNMAEEAEKERGAEIIKRGDRYFSVPRGSVSEEAPAEFETGGRVGAAKKAIEAAMKKAGQKKGQVADKDLTTLQDFHTSLGDRINERVREKMKLMESFDYSYKPGDRVFTEWSASNNYAPFEILRKTITEEGFVRDPKTSKILRDAEGNKVKREPEPGYLIRHQLNFNGEDIDHQYVIPAKNIKGLVEPDEPYKRGGPVGFENGGRVGKTREAAEKLLRVLHGSPTNVVPSKERTIDVTTDPAYAVKRGTDKMLGKSGPPMVNKFDIPEGRLLRFEEQYSPQDVALMKRFFNKLPGDTPMTGEEIYDLAQGRDVVLGGIAKAGGFAGYERPNTGAVGKGQWFRVTEPEELKRGKARGGLAQATKPL